jgi:8-oxo-dGTP pyrophosphatase MutT (NUDIX family)
MSALTQTIITPGASLVLSLLALAVSIAGPALRRWRRRRRRHGYIIAGGGGVPPDELDPEAAARGEVRRKIRG